jgi:hypothetical protein
MVWILDAGSKEFQANNLSPCHLYGQGRILPASSQSYAEAPGCGRPLILHARDKFLPKPIHLII